MAAGDELIDADGNELLDADGNEVVSDGTGDGCCCCPAVPCEAPDPCEACGGTTARTPGYMTLVFGEDVLVDTTGYFVSGEHTGTLTITGGSLAGLSYDLPYAAIPLGHYGCSWAAYITSGLPLTATWSRDGVDYPLVGMAFEVTHQLGGVGGLTLIRTAIAYLYFDDATTDPWPLTLSSAVVARCCTVPLAHPLLASPARNEQIYGGTLHTYPTDPCPS